MKKITPTDEPEPLKMTNCIPCCHVIKGLVAKKFEIHFKFKSNMTPWCVTMK
jgi:hypothetical protein